MSSKSTESMLLLPIKYPNIKYLVRQNGHDIDQIENTSKNGCIHFLYRRSRPHGAIPNLVNRRNVFKY